MKQTIKRALAAAMLVPVLALGVSFVTTGGAVFADTSGGIQGGIDATDPGTNDQATGNLTDVFKTVVNVLLFVIGAVAVIMLIVGGIRYTLSAGNSAAVTGAKNTILYAIIGLVVAFLAYAIINWVLGALNGNASTS